MVKIYLCKKTFSHLFRRLQKFAQRMLRRKNTKKSPFSRKKEGLRKPQAEVF